MVDRAAGAFVADIRAADVRETQKVQQTRPLGERDQRTKGEAASCLMSPSTSALAGFRRHERLSTRVTTGVRKAPRHEIAEWSTGGAAKSYWDLIVARDLKAVSEIVGLDSR
jgi:hypothetical protein